MRDTDVMRISRGLIDESGLAAAQTRVHFISRLKDSRKLRNPIFNVSLETLYKFEIVIVSQDSYITFVF